MNALKRFWAWYLDDTNSNKLMELFMFLMMAAVVVLLIAFACSLVFSVAISGNQIIEVTPK